ncbi:hypothetical protein Tco_0549525 [Tanacetum coccineum]
MSNNNLFSRSSSSSFRQSSASKIDQLYEISYVPDDSRILVEHLVSLSLPSDLPRHCLAQGYTHINFGAIMLALTFHGRKGLPVYSRMALLDTSSQSLNPYWWHTSSEYVSGYLSLPNGLPSPIGAIRLALTFYGRKGLPAYSRIALLDTSCLDEAAKINDDEDLPKKRKSSQQKLKTRYEKGDPTVRLLGEPLGKFDYYVLYPKAEPSQPLSPPYKTPPSPYKPPPTSPPPPKLSPFNQKVLSILHQDSPVFLITKDPSCSYLQEYEKEFPALTAFEHLDTHTKHDWKIKT